MTDIDLPSDPTDVDRPTRPVAPSLDDAAMAAARARQDRLTKPTGALGRLEEVSVWACGVQGRCPAEPFRRIRAVVFAGDHGVAAGGVSAYPPEVTAQMVVNLARGGAAANVLARQAGATLRVVDIAVSSDVPDVAADVVRHKVRRGSGRLHVEDALSREEAERALTAGAAIADEEIDAGADLLVPGDMGIGNTTPATVLTALLTSSEPHTLVGRGTGIDDAAWTRKAAAVRDGARRARRHLADPVALLATAGGADIAAMAAFLARAAERRTPVVLDGIVSAAAALVADRLLPGASDWWIAGHRSTEPAQAAALAALDKQPLLDLGMRLGEGTGALLAVPVVQAAVATLAEMATFDEAGVSDR